MMADLNDIFKNITDDNLNNSLFRPSDEFKNIEHQIYGLYEKFEEVLESFYQKTVNFKPLIIEVNEKIQSLHNIHEIEYLELCITHFEQYMEGYLCFNCENYSLLYPTKLCSQLGPNYYCSRCIEDISNQEKEGTPID